MGAMSKIPNPEINRIYPLNVHGNIVYLNKGEHLILVCLEYIIIIMFPAIFILMAINRYKKCESLFK